MTNPNKKLSDTDIVNEATQILAELNEVNGVILEEMKGLLKEADELKGKKFATGQEADTARIQAVQKIAVEYQTLAKALADMEGKALHAIMGLIGRRLNLVIPEKQGVLKP